MDQGAIVEAFRRLPDRDRLRLIDRLAAATDWSQFRGCDVLDAGLRALAADLAEAEGWGEDAGDLYLAAPAIAAAVGQAGVGQYVHPPMAGDSLAPRLYRRSRQRPA